jgi:hypothetical protein
MDVVDNDVSSSEADVDIGTSDSTVKELPAGGCVLADFPSDGISHNEDEVFFKLSVHPTYKDD